MIDFTDLLNKLHNELKISKTDLAKRSGLSLSYISLLMSGERKTPSIQTVNSLANAMALDSENRELLFKAAGHYGNVESALPIISRNIHPPNTLREDWGGAPNVSVFYGRKKELVELEHRIVDDHSRIVAVVGLGGMGKTTLALKLTEQIKDNFEYILWHSLQNAPAIETILGRSNLFLSKQHHADLPKDVDDQISQLIVYLRRSSCLIVLDNYESVLQGSHYLGQYLPGFEGYGKLVRRIGETIHNSCLLLTSREKPKELGLLEGSSSSVYTLSLHGLNSIDGQAILRDKGLSPEETYEDLIELYAGNPLALKLVSQFIQEVFGGKIDSFLKDKKAVFSDIREVLNQQFERLSELEQQIVYWLAIEREPITLNKLQTMLLQPIAERELQEALRSLRRRSFMEVSEDTFFLEPVILEFVTDRFVSAIITELESGILKLFASHAFIEAQARDQVRNAQTRLILVPILEWFENNFVKEESQNKLMNLVPSMRKMPPVKAGYAVGNVLNLLIKLGADIAGSDFSDLPVRQAFLQEATLFNVNFAYSDLTTLVFKETFGSIISVAFNQDNSLLAAGTANGEVRVWKISDGTPYISFQGHTDWVRSVVFNSDGTLLASSSDDKTVRLWNVHTGECLQVLEGHRDWVWSVAFSPNGRTLASGSHDHTIRLWDAKTGECLQVLYEHSSIVYSVAFSPDGRSLASGSEDHTIRLWDAETGECLQILEDEEEEDGSSNTVSLAFNFNGSRLVSGSSDRKVRLWDVQTEERLRVLEGHEDWVWTVAFSPDDSTLASGSEDHTIRLWDVETGECLQTLQGHSELVYSVAFSSDGRTLASGSQDHTIRLWDVETGECLQTLQGYSNWIYSVAFNPEGTILASGSQDHTIRLWDVETGKLLHTLPGHSNTIYSVAFSPDGRTLASGSEDHTIRLWDVETGKLLHTLPGRVYSVAFSRDECRLVSGSWDKTLRLWDVNTGECLKTWQGYDSWIFAVAFSPDGYTVASGNEDRTVRLWDINTGECLRTLRGHSHRVWSVAFSSDGNTLASASEDHTLRLWDVHTGECLQVLEGHLDSVRAVVFSPDGGTILSGSQDKTLRLWDVNTGKCVRLLDEHLSWVWSVDYHRDGRTVASGSHDGTIKLWDVWKSKCLHTMRSKRPYENMNITGVKGLNEVQKNNLIALGAISDEW